MHFRLVALSITAILLLTGCNRPTGGTLLHETDQTVTYSISKTGDPGTGPAVTIKPGDKGTVPIPPGVDITVSATYDSGFAVPGLFTQEDLKNECNPRGESYDCRFVFNGQQINIVARNPAEDFAADFSFAIVIFGIGLLGVTLFLFFRNRKSDSSASGTD